MQSTLFNEYIQMSETRNRIRLAVAAYAYEYESDSIMSDADFDELSYKIIPQLETGNPMLDTFFQEEFTPCTGQWVTKHPEKDKLKYIYHTIFKGRK